MTITEPTVSERPAIRLATVDLYRDIHKGIRTKLFDVTAAAGRLDPQDRHGKRSVAVELDDVVGVLVSHAEHEDRVLQPVLFDQLPSLADKIETDHHTLEGRLPGLQALAAESLEASSAQERLAAHALYLELASFTSAYLEHQDVEERIVLPAIEDAVGVDACGAMHHAIVSSIPPDEMAHSLSFMLPSMNLADRAELLGGMRQGAPAEVFEGIWGLAASVLTAEDHRALGVRLGIG